LSLTVELLYLASGVVLPLFYLPQMLRIYNDRTRLASYSLIKALCQLLLRLPAMAFAVAVVGNGFMVFVLALDIAGRLAELCIAIWSLRSQGVDWASIAGRLLPLELVRRRTRDLNNSTANSTMLPTSGVGPT
jgi:hypothetical protein